MIITSDKVYKNFEVKRGYKERHNWWTGSLQCIKRMRRADNRSYFHLFEKEQHRKLLLQELEMLLAEDWSNELSLIALNHGKVKSVILRNPNSTRPWQNVLDVIRGYMILAKTLREKLI